MEGQLQHIIEIAIMATFDVYSKDIDKKIQEAINLGAKIGAEVGAQAGAAAAIKAAEREKKKIRAAQYDKRFHNTKLLLKHYRSLNEHYHNAVFDMKTAESASEDFSDIMQIMNKSMDEALYIESIKQSCTRTKIIMTHVNKMLDIYKIMCERSHRPDDKRRWRVLEALYIADEGTPAVEIAANEHIDKRTVYKDIDVCIVDLTTLLFGIGGIENN